MVYLLIGYMFLFIHRPFEFWPILGEFHLERVYMAVLAGCWLLFPQKQLPANRLHLAYLSFALALLLCWGMSSWTKEGQGVVENWFKIFFFYILVVTTVADKRSLRKLVLGFLLVMTVYMAHSFREYLAGRHTYRMGIVRMIGIDTSQGDPNSFGASLVFALPFVIPFWNTTFSKQVRLLLIGYVGLSTLCVLLTGSRSAFLGLMIWFTWIIWRSRYRFRFLAMACIAAPLMFLFLPNSLQTRFESILNPEVAPENARISGQSRLEGLLTGLDLFLQNPFCGIGPGAWRPATGSTVESHNLYGQLMGEMGFLGVASFAWILLQFRGNRRWFQRQARRLDGLQQDWLFQFAHAVQQGIWLMLILGLFGHNLFRHNWLWYGAFLILARQGVLRELRLAQTQVRSWIRPRHAPVPGITGPSPVFPG